MMKSILNPNFLVHKCIYRKYLSAIRNRRCIQNNQHKASSRSMQISSNPILFRTGLSQLIEKQLIAKEIIKQTIFLKRICKSVFLPHATFLHVHGKAFPSQIDPTDVSWHALGDPSPAQALIPSKKPGYTSKKTKCRKRFIRNTSQTIHTHRNEKRQKILHVHVLETLHKIIGLQVDIRGRQIENSDIVGIQTPIIPQLGLGFTKLSVLH